MLIEESVANERLLCSSTSISARISRETKIDSTVSTSHARHSAWLAGWTGDALPWPGRVWMVIGWARPDHSVTRYALSNGRSRCEVSEG